MFFLLCRCALTTFFHFLQIGGKSARKAGMQITGAGTLDQVREGRKDTRRDLCLRVESGGEMSRGPVEKEIHPECAPRPLIQPCCLAMTNIYLLQKMLEFFFSSH